MWSDAQLTTSRRRESVELMAVRLLMLSTVIGRVHNLKCRTTDHSRRQGEFVDIAEQCNNMTTGDRSTATMDNDYGSSGSRYNGKRDRDSDRYSNNGWRTEDKSDNNNNSNNRRNNNREYSVRRQDFGNNGDRGNGDRGYGDRGNGDRGNGDRGNGDRGNGNGGDRDRDSCDVRPSQQYSGNNNGRERNRQQGRPYNPIADYDTMRQSNSGHSPQTRRYRRDTNGNRMNSNNNNNKLLGNNRFRNATKNGANQAKGSILDKMDACTIHCVFNQLEMLNSNSRPDKSAIVNIMTNQIKDVELKEFVQDSIDECFDTLELDSHTNKCEFSKNFAVCMENKAQRNCDDWDENVSSNKANSAQDGNNQPDKRKGY